MPRPRIPPIWLVLSSIASVQVGAAIAKNLFGTVSPTTLVGFRLLTSAVVLLLIVRRGVRGHSRRDWLIALAFGVCLVSMNWAIYQAYARIPLGIAVTIEFLGPLAVAVIGSKRLADLVWVGLAGLGVALLGLSPAQLNLAGVAFALLAGLLWAGYILLSRQTGRRWPGISGLAVASLVGAVLIAPAAIVQAGDQLREPRILLLGLAIGLLSSVIPYSFELIALRRMPARVFGILMSLEPAAAALVAMIFLGEFLSPVQWLAIGCVVAASIGAARGAGPMQEPAPD